MPKDRIVITIDGLAGSGKSALSRSLAARLGFVLFSSGLLYRGMGYLARKAGCNLADGAKVSALLKEHSLELFLTQSDASRIKIDGIDLTDSLAAPEISEAASTVGVHKEVRDALFDLQRKAFMPRPLCAEGRDMGTVVFPDAELKIFVVADVDVRVARRLDQLGISHNDPKANQSIRQEILERDERDSKRALAPTVAASDAVTIDNSKVSLTELVDFVYSLALARGLLKDALLKDT